MMTPLPVDPNANRYADSELARSPASSVTGFNSSTAARQGHGILPPAVEEGDELALIEDEEKRPGDDELDGDAEFEGVRDWRLCSA